MFLLDASLAQSIVDRAMQILRTNVNVMDERGLIIASGDRARIGTRHEGALLVLAQGRAVEVDEGFHARFSAEARRYRYVLLNRRIRPGLAGGRVGWTHGDLDEEAMAAAAACLAGEHDFTSFRAAECQAKSPVRLMHSVSVQRRGEVVVFDFHANAFLHHMIRNLVGSLVFVGKGRRPVDWMAELLAARNRSLAAPTFAPDGLYLCGVDYPPQWPLPGGGRIIAPPQLLLP